jgi:hypothetical protein
MQAAASSQLPYSLDWIQFGAIRRQVVQSKIVGVFVSPRLMKQGVMVFGIVGDYNHPATGSDTDAPEALHESKESRAIELAGLTTELKSSVPQPHSTKVSNAVPCRSVQQNGVFRFLEESTSCIGSHAAGSALRRWPRDRLSRRPLAFGVFFMGFLPRRVGLGNAGTRLAQPKAQLPEQTLALPDPEVNPILFGNPRCQRLAIP